MLRDTRRNAAYFSDWIAKQERRIQNFSEDLEKDRKDRPEALFLGHIFLSGFLGNLMSAQYSYGEPLDKIRRTYGQYLAHIGTMEELTYNQALTTLSMGILLGVSSVTVFQKALYPEDAFLEALLNWQRGYDPPQRGKLLFPETSAVMIAFLLGKCPIEDFRTFIRDSWYPANCEEPWYNSDMLSDGTYCGYWCFSGAAVAMIKGCTQMDFQGVEYFPIDMLPA